MSPSLSLALTSVEKRVLYNKYRGEGMDSFEANKKVSGMCEHMKLFAIKLGKRKNKLTDEEIDKKFKQEFEKLMMSY